MPAEDVVVYCVSCAKAMFIGGKRPRYLVDLLFGEATVPGTSISTLARARRTFTASLSPRTIARISYPESLTPIRASPRLT